jgi:hypothetical protein
MREKDLVRLRVPFVGFVLLRGFSGPVNNTIRELKITDGSKGSSKGLQAFYGSIGSMHLK